jgi:hypothetical protein
VECGKVPVVGNFHETDFLGFYKNREGRPSVLVRQRTQESLTTLLVKRESLCHLEHILSVCLIFMLYGSSWFQPYYNRTQMKLLPGCGSWFWCFGEIVWQALCSAINHMLTCLREYSQEWLIMTASAPRFCTFLQNELGSNVLLEISFDSGKKW